MLIVLAHMHYLTFSLCLVILSYPNTVFTCMYLWEFPFAQNLSSKYIRFKADWGFAQTFLQMFNRKCQVVIVFHVLHVQCISKNTIGF